ncbi:hypothetical protein [Methylobacterium sp. WL18]|nr:hypothetical protein [Methylobacterium sp. WL18]
MSTPILSLPDDTIVLNAMLIVREAEADRLHQIIKEIQRHCFGYFA